MHECRIAAYQRRAADQPGYRRRAHRGACRNLISPSLSGGQERLRISASISSSVGTEAVAAGAPETRASARVPRAAKRCLRARKRRRAVFPKRRSFPRRMPSSSSSAGAPGKRGSMRMQSTGQGGRHSPQPTHSSWMTVWVKLRLPMIASTGHAGRHRAQPTHSDSSIRATEGCTAQSCLANRLSGVRYRTPVSRSYLTRCTPRSRQIFRASKSSISRCRGTAERWPFLSLPHQECRLPSRIMAHPCRRKCLSNSDRFTQDDLLFRVAVSRSR